MKRKKKMQQQDLTYDEKIALIKKINQKMREELVDECSKKQKTRASQSII